jgi:oxygen-independent coproporphyrinogen-3 oxidase
MLRHMTAVMGGLEELVELDPARVEATLVRYAGAGPRYTSYPTVPAWSEAYGPDAFRRDLGALAPGHEIALYAHVPFCRSLCHFCACNRVVTRRPEPVSRYLDAIEREVANLREALAGPVRVGQHHWGGGTPTHLDAAQVRRLFRALDDAFPAEPGAERSVEADPRVTGEAHLDALRECGMNRLSLGVQDFDPRVQQAIHRLQDPATTARLVARARERGFESVNLDLIYGLPFQSVESIERTLDHVIAIAPDRIALYAYAHVTWVAKQQRGFERGDLPSPPLRLRIQLAAIRRLLRAGYVHVGMDHFARPGDALARAARERTLRRNFMGYTTRAGLELLGVGPSAISELAASYAQSERDLERWEEAARAGELATRRGHALGDDDQERRWVIAEIMCHGELRATDYRARFGGELGHRFAPELASLEPLAADGLVDVASDGSLRVTALGRLLVRNVAMAFDAYLPAQRAAERPLFSQTV